MVRTRGKRNDEYDHPISANIPGQTDRFLKCAWRDFKSTSSIQRTFPKNSPHFEPLGMGPYGRVLRRLVCTAQSYSETLMSWTPVISAEKGLFRPGVIESSK